MPQRGSQPSFLMLSRRPTKPRKSGVTHVLDKGFSASRTLDILDSAANFIDVWKFGWGISYIDPALEVKLARLKAAQIKSCTGGTLLEISWLQNKTKEFFDFAKQVGFDCVEISNGAVPMPISEKRRLIQSACDLGFEVMAEVGSKNARSQMADDRWQKEVEGDLAAGACWIIIEGRESGTVGLYRSSGEVRWSLLRRLQRRFGGNKIIYEAPQRGQQVSLIQRLGAEVNLGNIAIDEVLSLETLRLGLRADTLNLELNLHGSPSPVNQLAPL